MSDRGRRFFDAWVLSRFYGFNPPHLQNSNEDNVRYLIAEAKHAGIDEIEMAAEFGGDLYKAVFDAMMEALKPNATRT